MDYTAEGLPFLPFRVDYCSVNAALNLVARTRSTIIIEIIIAVHPVLGAVILFEQGKEFPLLSRSQIQLLFINRRTAQGIFRLKVRIGRNSQLVVCLPFHKAQNKMRSIETEHSVIEHQVCLV